MIHRHSSSQLLDLHISELKSEMKTVNTELAPTSLDLILPNIQVTEHSTKKTRDLNKKEQHAVLRGKAPVRRKKSRSFDSLNERIHRISFEEIFHMEYETPNSVVEEESLVFVRSVPRKVKFSPFGNPDKYKRQQTGTLEYATSLTITGIRRSVSDSEVNETEEKNEIVQLNTGKPTQSDINEKEGETTDKLPGTGSNELNETMAFLRLKEDSSSKMRRHSAPEESAGDVALPTLPDTKQNSSSLDTSLNNLDRSTSCPFDSLLTVEKDTISGEALTKGDEINTFVSQPQRKPVVKLPPLNWARDRRATREFCHYIPDPRGCIEEAILKRRGFCPTNPKLKKKKKLKERPARKVMEGNKDGATRKCSIMVPASTDFERTFLRHQDSTVSSVNDEV